MAITLVIVPMVLPDSLVTGWLGRQFVFVPGSVLTPMGHIRFLAVFYLFLGLAANAGIWQAPEFVHDKFINDRYDVWVFLLITGPIITIMTFYGNRWQALIDTGVICAYSALWNMLRVFLRKRYPLPTESKKSATLSS